MPTTRYLLLLSLIASSTLTGCGLCNRFIQPVAPIPEPLLAPCDPPAPPLDGRMSTISHSLIEAVSAYRACASSHDDLIYAVRNRQPAQKGN